MNPIEQAKVFVETYRQEHGFASPFKSGEYALTPENWRESYIPYCEEQGVYLFFGPSGKLLYVGKASMSHKLGARICSHFRSKPQLRTLRTCWSETPSNLLVVAVNKPYEAPSLEEYLIEKLNPEDNTFGKVLSTEIET